MMFEATSFVEHGFEKEFMLAIKPDQRADKLLTNFLLGQGL